MPRKIGFVGLGKLGLPVALAIEAATERGIVAVEANPERCAQIESRQVPEMAHEPHLADLLATTGLQLANDMAGLADMEVVFVCVQTPHTPELEGNLPVTVAPRDFDYGPLQQALTELAATGYQGLTVIVSTCLPGTVERIAPEGLNIAYNPLFIAMGNVIPDFHNPEFVLVGHPDGRAPDALASIYEVVTDAPIRAMSIRSAELTKVAYNAFIGFKLLLANTIGELADRTGTDADKVMGALKTADQRLISTAYLTPGVGDGGACHPRDQIALSWLAEHVGLSHNPFEMVVRAREAHARWLADIWCDEADGKPLVLLGEAYKPNTTLTTGSGATLIAEYAAQKGHRVITTDTPPPAGDCCYLIGTRHDWIGDFTPLPGAVVVDPWGTFAAAKGVRVVRPGRRADPDQLQGPGNTVAAASGLAGGGGA